MSDTLLTYDCATEPEPLVASPPAGEPALAAVTVEVTNDGKQIVNCRRIVFSFPVGDNAKDFFTDPTGIGVTRPAGWSVTQSGGLFTAAPTANEAAKVGQEGLTFAFSNIKVNRRHGTFFLRITEEAATGANAEQRQATLRLTKFPSAPQAYLDVDSAAVSEGGGVTLSWDAEGGGTYVIEYGGVKITHPKNDPGLPLPARGSYRVDGLRDNPTIFHLTASYHEAGLDHPVVVRRQYAVTVNPLRPEIKLFRGALLVAKDGGRQLALKWDAANADHCTLTGAHHHLRPSCADDSYRLALDLSGQPDKTYELTAVRAGAEPDAARLTVGWQLEEAAGAALDHSQHCVAVSPDGERLYVAGEVNHATVIRALDARTLRPVGDAVGTTMNVKRLAVAHDGALLYAAGETRGTNQRALVLDARTLLPVGEPLTREAAVDVAVSPDGARVYVNHGNRVQVFDAHTRRPVAEAELKSWTYRFALSADGARLYLMETTANPLLWVFDAQTLRMADGPFHMDKDVPAHSVAASPDGARLYAAGYFDIRALDARTLLPVGQPLRHHNGMGLAVSPDGTRVYMLKIDGITVLSTLSVTGGRGPAR